MFRRIMAAFCSIATMIISVVSIMGHVLGVEKMYTWTPKFVGMAPNTAWALFILSIGVLLLCIPKRQN